MPRVATLATWLVLLAACAQPTPTAEVDNPNGKRKTSYNRREIQSPSTGVFTGRDGSWTIYRSDRTPPAQPSPADCEGEQNCEPVPDETGDAGE